MKTYLLRDPNAVEPQKPARPPRRQPAPPPRPPGPVLYLGLDVHNDSIAVSLAPSDATEVRRYGIIGGQHDDVLKLLKKLAAAHPGVALRCCYEAGPRGFPLCRCLRQHGHACLIVAPSKVPRQPGDRVKADRWGVRAPGESWPRQRVGGHERGRSTTAERMRGAESPWAVTERRGLGAFRHRGAEPETKSKRQGAAV